MSTNIIQDLGMIAPEIFLLSMSCIILILNLFLSDRFKILSYNLILFSLIITAALSVAVLTGANMIPGTADYAFSKHWVVDHFSQLIKTIMVLMVAFIFIYSRPYLENRKIAIDEYQLLVLFSTIGMMLLASANSTLMVYLGLELLSLPLYTLVALNRDSAVSVEAGMKYFIMGALASGFLLYGFSLLFGLTGSLILPEIATQIWAAQDASLALFLLALVFIVVGITFKFGAVPFHMWIPDVYQGATSSVTMLISSAPKVAAFAMTYRLLSGALPDLSQVFGVIFVLFAILSLIVGNLAAIVQTNIKRMLGYSAIGQLGFIFLGLAAGGFDGYMAVIFYILVYTVLVLGAFGIIVLISSNNPSFEAENISDFKGLAKRNPWLAFLMMLFLFSFAGVPPMVGFYAKLLILQVLINMDLTWLAAFAVFFSVVGAFYYLRVIKAMYFDEPIDNTSVNIPIDARIAISINGLAALGLGIFPAPLFSLCQKMLGG